MAAPDGAQARAQAQAVSPFARIPAYGPASLPVTLSERPEGPESKGLSDEVSPLPRPTRSLEMTGVFEVLS